VFRQAIDHCVDMGLAAEEDVGVIAIEPKSGS